MVEVEIFQMLSDGSSEPRATIIVDEAASNPDRQFRVRGDRRVGEMIRDTHVEDHSGNRLTYQEHGETWAQWLPWAFEQGDDMYAQVLFTTPR